METEEFVVAVETVAAPAPIEATVAVEEPTVVPAKAKKEPKPKKSGAPKKPKKASAHSSYIEMITDAIVTLKEKSGSSQYAITKFLEEKYKGLSDNFKMILLVQLRKLLASVKIVKVKGSFKLLASKTPLPKSIVTKKKPAAAKPKAKVTVKKSLTKTKAKAIAKPKPKSVSKSKPKVAAKPKAADAKPKTVAEPKVVAKGKAAAAKTKAASKPMADVVFW